MAMELVYYRNRSLTAAAKKADGVTATSPDGYYDYSAADKWAPHALDYIKTVSAIAQDTLTGLQRLRGYTWQRSMGCVRACERVCEVLMLMLFGDVGVCASVCC